LWAISIVVALTTTAFLVVRVVRLYPAVWQNLSTQRVAMLITMSMALVAVIVLLAIGGTSLGWTGFADKTLWEWLQLLGALAIPVVLAAAGLWFTAQQDQRQQEIEDQRVEEAQKIEEQRAESERQLGEQRAQDTALQAYLDQMSSLLLDKDRPLRQSKEGAQVRTLARARTLTLLPRLDGDRKGSVMQFLYESDLLFGTVDLGGADLRGAYVRGADLRDAYVTDADLRDANLSNADLSGANLNDTNLRGANLRDANLRGANLDFTNLRDADLRGAYLRDAPLSNADLRDANLSNADLSDADLEFADLRYSDLSGSYGVTKEMLEHLSGPLEGATMPDGTIYPGRYAAREFEPAVSFEVGEEDWELAAPETPDALFIQTGPLGGQLLFTNPLHVFDSSNRTEPKKLPTPESAKEWVSWFQRHPNLDTSKSVSVSVGDASGKQIDVTASSTPENYPRDLCGGEPCVPLYPISDSRILSYEGFKDRFIILDVEGETVIIDAGAPADKFDEFLPKAQKVLDTVEWKGG
jgi:uncharacterized protein YjbI with pentapeptide repeats